MNAWGADNRCSKKSSGGSEVGPEVGRKVNALPMAVGEQGVVPD